MSSRKCQWKPLTAKYWPKKDAGALRFDLIVENGSLLMHGNEADGRSSLLSGHLAADVLQDGMGTEKVYGEISFRFVLHHHLGKRVEKCHLWEVAIHAWDFIWPLRLAKGRHQFPISMLVPSKIPVTIETAHFSIQYELTAKLRHESHSKHVSRPILVRRTLPCAESLRLSPVTFAPLDVLVQVQHQKFICPDDSNSVSLRLENLLGHNKESGQFEFWRLKRVAWRLEESTKLKNLSSGLDSAQSHDSELDADNRRTITMGSLWKSWQTLDWCEDGTTTLDFAYTLSSRKRFTRGRNYAATTHSPYGIDISHLLTIDMILCKEIRPESQPKMAVQSTMGKTLRVERDIIVVEKLEEDIGWEEVPPVYEDVPIQPPPYDTGGRSQDS